MSGVVAGLIGSVKAGSTPAPTNLVTNPSFSVNLNGWINSTNPVRDTSVFRSSPASLNTSFDGENSPYAYYIQDTSLTIGQRYSLSFWLRNADLSRTYQIDFLGSSTTTSLLGTSTDWQYFKFENVLATSTQIVLAIYPTDIFIGEFNLDDVSVVLGATALP
jgi:hypothetical protein